MKKIETTLHLYDEELELTIKEEEQERYIAAAEFVTQKYNAYAQAYQGKKSDHTIALMTLLDVALNPMD
jgi:cell division protein ZapA